MSELTTSVEKKSTLAFSFSKVKPKTSLSVKSTETVKAFELSSKRTGHDDDEDKREIIGAIVGNKIKSISNPESNEKAKPLVIPCQKNHINFNPKLISNASAEDLEVIKEMINDTLKSKNEKEPDANLTVDMPSEKPKEAENIDEPNYEAIGIEQFGLAALRGMGWNEKKGIGLTNKRQCAVYEPELRPKGLGLGAGLSKKHRSDKSDSDKQQEESSSSLRYSKGAYIQVTSGKNSDDYGKIVGFDDGLDRILVQLSNDQTVSLLQSCTRLVSKSDYKKATERSNR